MDRWIYWAGAFFVLALLFAFLGLGGAAFLTFALSRVLFFVFLALGAVALLLSRRVPG